MSDEKARPEDPGIGTFDIIVKGGTTRSSYDKELSERRHAAEVGRAHQDKQMAAAAAGTALTPEGLVTAKLSSLRMMDRDSPRLVLYYMNRDKTVRQECVSELVVLSPTDALFTLMCPKCFERGVPAGDCQIQVQKSHRKWELDPRRAGEFVRLTDPFGEVFHVRICGTVSSEEILRCSNYNCNWAVRVENSRVYEV